MLNKILETPVDLLVKLVKEHKNCSTKFLLENLRVDEKILEKWILVLEEYGVLKVFYNGFEEYVKLSEKELNSSNSKINLDLLRDLFIESSNKKKIPYDKMVSLWPQFIIEYEEQIEELFYQKAKNLNFNEKKIKLAWNTFRESLEVF